MNTKVLGKNIVYLRKKNDITQLILAEKIGISRKQLYNYERAKVKNPTCFVLSQIAMFFNIQQELLDSNDLELVERNGGNISDGN